MKNFVISLIDASERRNHISNEFYKKNITFTFFDAINKSQIDFTSQQLNLNLANADLTQGEKACLLSHVSLWKIAIDLNLPYIAIYEDDILLGTDIESFLLKDEWIPTSVDIIKLEVFAESALMGYEKKIVNNARYLRRLKGIHLGAAGYILSQNSARSLLKYIQSLDKITAIDHILFEDFVMNLDLSVYQLCPGLCIQSDRLNQDRNKILSQLESERRERLDINMLKHKKIKQSLFFKIKREYKRFILKISLLFCRIEFK